MSLPDLTPEQAEEAERIYQTPRPVSDVELRRIAHLLASKPDHRLLGETEFEVRDRVHRIGAKAIDAALNERGKGGAGGPA